MGLRLCSKIYFMYTGFQQGTVQCSAVQWLKTLLLHQHTLQNAYFYTSYPIIISSRFFTCSYRPVAKRQLYISYNGHLSIHIITNSHILASHAMLTRSLLSTTCGKLSQSCRKYSTHECFFTTIICV